VSSKVGGLQGPPSVLKKRQVLRKENFHGGKVTYLTCKAKIEECVLNWFRRWASVIMEVGDQKGAHFLILFTLFSCNEFFGKYTDFLIRNRRSVQTNEICVQYGDYQHFYKNGWFKPMVGCRAR
jgi:hypothetical protein